MNYLLKYLDWKRATINALKDFPAMKSIIDNTPKVIQQRRECNESLPSMKLGDVRAQRRSTGFAEKLSRSLDEISLLEERYREAQLYMEWMIPAWEALSPDDQFVLKTFYIQDCDNAAQIVSDELNVERTTAYTRKSRALARLTTSLYGTSR